jgi:protein-tyrosine phosphatase
VSESDSDTTLEEPDLFEVVFICTGNRARSALAEALYSRHTVGLATRARSYGTQDGPPTPALPLAVEAASRLGVDLASHRSRSLHAARLDSADLVLGFEPFHVSLAVIDGGAQADRTFLLGEFAALTSNAASSDGAPERAREIVAWADARRVRSRPDPAAILPDPLDQPERVMTATAARIDELVRQIVQTMFEVVSETSADDDP